MLDLDQFIGDCRAALGTDPTHKAAREVVARAVAEPAAVRAGLGESRRAGIEPLCRSDNLTILNVVWGPA